MRVWSPVLCIAVLSCKDVPSGPFRDAGGHSDVPFYFDATNPQDAGTPILDAEVDHDADETRDADETQDAESPDRSDPETPTPGTEVIPTPLGQAQVRITGAPDRTYELTTTATLRDGASSTRTLSESPDAPKLRSGHAFADALFALSWKELEESRVESVRDGSFSNGNPIDCSCFIAGERWTFPWTRDVAYATHLALGWLEPNRAARSVEFAISGPKNGLTVGPEVMQDTGTGGSWPVSIDRVVTSLAAEAIIPALDEPERSAFRRRVAEALANGLERDRRVAFDSVDGLYRGESSFLDWREQTYPRWMATEPAQIASSKSLSTNLLMKRALEVTAELWSTERPADASRYRMWANDLGQSILRELSDQGTISAGKGGVFDPSKFPRRDLLAESLLILSGLADAPLAQSLVATYPRGILGPPVVWPETSDVPIYHNRATWPFVTAYAGLAARVARNSAVFDASVDNLMKSTALHLTNVENLDAATGAWFVDDGPRSGPVVSSRRQLWSVAGYLGLWVRGLFGVQLSTDGLTFEPFVSPELHQSLFRGMDHIRLERLPVGSHRLTLELQFPREVSQGPYLVRRIMRDGVEVTLPIPIASLGTAAQLTIELGPGPAMSRSIRSLPSIENSFAPQEPSMRSVRTSNGHFVVEFQGNADANVTYDIFRNGQVVGQGVAGPTWTDPNPVLTNGVSCFSVAARHETTGLQSHHAPPQCLFEPASETIIETYPGDWVSVGGFDASSHGELHRDDWGDPEDTITTTLTPRRSGRHLLQLRHGNGAGPINTGLAASVKSVRVQSDRQVIREGAVVMPQLGTWDRFADSTVLELDLVGGQPIEVQVSDFANMTYFSRSSLYSGNGGGAAPFNRTNIAVIRLLWVGER